MTGQSSELCTVRLGDHTTSTRWCRPLRSDASPRRSKERGSCYTQKGHSILLKKFLHLVFKLHLVPILL